MTGELCVIHESCDGTEEDCRTGRGTRPLPTDDSGRIVEGWESGYNLCEYNTDRAVLAADLGITDEEYRSLIVASLAARLTAMSRSTAMQSVSGCVWTSTNRLVYTAEKS